LPADGIESPRVKGSLPVKVASFRPVKKARPFWEPLSGGKQMAVTWE
jgi:hypothetical protein